MPAPPDWQLPAGVSRGVWDYLHDSTVAAGADESERDSPLLARDLAFAIEHLPTGGRIVDLGCGPGRAAIELARRGHAVVAIDLSASMLAACGRNAVAAAVTVERVQANIVELDALASNTFDGVLCLFSTLGMISDARHRQAAIDHAARILRPGGRLIVHVHNRGSHWLTMVGRRWLMADVVRRLRRSENVGDWAMPHAPDRVGWTMHLFSRRELERRLVTAGLRMIRIEPVGLRPDGRLAWPSFLPSLRAYGFLAAAEKPR